MKESIMRLYSLIGDGNSSNLLEAINSNDCLYIINEYKQGRDLSILDEREESLLHKAAKNNYYEMFDLLIHLGLDYNQKNIYHETPLHLACLFNNGEVVTRIILEGIDVNVVDKRGVSPLHIAASRGNLEIINSLMNAGAKINCSDENGAKPIHYAVKSGKREIIRVLLNYGASLMETDERKNNVLHLAALKGDNNLIHYILRHMVITNSLNIYGQTALHLAAIHCSKDTLKKLLNAGYDPLIISKNNKTCLDLAKENFKYENYDFLKQYITSLEYKERFANYELHQAARNNNYSLFIQMVNEDNVNDKDYFGKSLIYYAINSNSLEMVKRIISLGGSISNVDEYNHNALLVAVYNDSCDIIKLLLEAGADPNDIYYDRSYLYRAILKNNYEVAKLLIEHKADTNYIDSRHRTIYSYAVDYGSDEIVNLLLNFKT